MMNLQPGQNISISRQNPNTRRVEVDLGWGAAIKNLEVDSSAFALNSQGRVTGDEGFIFYNQPELAGGGLRRDPQGHKFTIDFELLPAAVEKIALTLTLHQGRLRGQAFSHLQKVAAEVRDAQTQAVIASFELPTASMPETALIVAELYRRNQEWKLRAVGQGFVGGLGPLAQSYGVDVSDDPEAETPPVAPPTPTAEPVPPRPVRLDKITLEKKGQSISLEKKGQGFGEIVVNLNWSAGGGSAQGGFFSRLKGSQRIDLDLGCLVRLQSGQTGAVQALGNSFGSLTEPPYIQLMGDDRSGDSARGEFLHINGRHWDKIERVLVYAFIYDGVPNWAAADAVVTLSTPGQPTLEVRLDSHSSNQGMCAIALLENRSGSIHVSKLVEYFRSHKPMDQAYGFGLRWAAGSKD
jgi:tellurite resistance protein TerA